MNEVVEMRVLFWSLDDLDPCLGTSRPTPAPITDERIESIVADFRARLVAAKQKLGGYAYLGHGPTFDSHRGF